MTIFGQCYNLLNNNIVYLYCALINKNKIKENEKKIIMLISLVS